MSYILDALKKSEQERELVRMLRTAGAAGYFWVPARRRLWPAIVVLALFAGIALTVLRWWPAQAPTSVANEITTETSLPTQAAMASGQSATDDLAAQARVASAPESAPVARPPTPPQASAEPAVGEPANPEATAPIDAAAVPLLREMPADFRRQLPELTVNIHLYSADEAENLVYINDQQLRRGEQLKGGIKLEEIVADGVVLSYAGTYFKLPRPN
jgi:hypothetical protein